MSEPNEENNRLLNSPFRGSGGLEIDQTTYADLSLFNQEEEYSIFHKLDFTRTRGGKDQLIQLFHQPFSDLRPIRETQKILSIILERAEEWPLSISNGTVMVVERFYETALDEIPNQQGFPYPAFFKLFHGPDYSLIRYSVGHFADFLGGMNRLVTLLNTPDCPRMLKTLLERIARHLDHAIVRSLIEQEGKKKWSPSEVVHYGHYIRNRFKNSALELIGFYNQLDAWYSMAMATRYYQLCFPQFMERSPNEPKEAQAPHAHQDHQDRNAPQDHNGPYLDVRALYHILLPNPVSYDVVLDKAGNFLFLTGANMAGKSTFIRSVGVAVFLAHLGMGVPAKEMHLRLFDGILSNINVMDNISKGESYFFNEVQRIRDTLTKITGNQKWLVLIDELFKGTNVQDAMKCSTTVIKGLIRIRNSVFILSTHLYEIGEELRQYPNISFKYFETAVKDDQLEFSYQLKDGISNDRLGYLILKREKVVEMLEKL
ncbi:MutS-related protein [Flavitalea flava]